MSACPTFEELNAFADGALANHRELEVRRHLDACPACCARAGAVTALKQAVGCAYPAQGPPPRLRRAVMAQLPTRRRRRRWWLAPAAAFVLVTAGIAVWRWHRALQPTAAVATLLADPVDADIVGVSSYQPMQPEVATTIVKERVVSGLAARERRLAQVPSPFDV